MHNNVGLRFKSTKSLYLVKFLFNNAVKLWNTLKYLCNFVIEKLLEVLESESKSNVVIYIFYTLHS